MWSEYEDLNTISKGDPYENDPYTLEELDDLVPSMPWLKSTNDSASQPAALTSDEVKPAST